VDAIIGDAEPRFLDLGERLRALYTDADGLVNQARRAAAAVGGDESTGVLPHLEEMVGAAMADLRDRREAISGRLEEVMRSAEQLARLSSICSAMAQTGLSLNVVGLNIAVESSRSSASVEMFSVFTEEIRGLSRRISDISEAIRDGSARTRNGQLAAYRQIRGGLDTLSRLIAEAEEIVGRAMERIREIMAYSRRALERSTESSREISRLVGEVVVAIQFHDISRQKVEHVGAALADAAALLERPAEERPVIRGRVHRLLTLQVIHLQEVVDEIRAARDRAARAFERLNAQVADLVADAARLDGNEAADGGLDAHRQGLENGLRQLRELLGKGRTLDRDIRRIAEEGAEAASRLSDHIDPVRDISFDLHLKALNAIVKSARLPREGQALEVLAQEVSKLSTQSGGAVDDVVEILESLVSLSLDLDLMDEADAGEKDQADAAIADGLEEMARRFDQFRTDAAAAPEAARAIQGDIAATGDRLGFLDALAADLTDRIARLTALAERFTPWSQAARRGSAETIEQAARRYTMESERRLHSRHLGEAAGLAAGAGAAELFDGESSAEDEGKEGGGPAAAPPDRDAAPAAPAEGEAAADADGAGEEAEDGEDLGNNVELF
jgi:methyl-accepting chemotaxis protein